MIKKQNAVTMKDVEYNDQFKYFLKKPKKYWSDVSQSYIEPRSYKKYLRTDLASIFENQGISDPFLKEREIVAMVFPFKVCEYVIENINWSQYLKDPLFLLTFPQPDMLKPFEIRLLKILIDSGASREAIAEKVSQIRSTKNPAPANQSSNRPTYFDDDSESEEVLDGVQHKYKNIILMFHKNAQTCHAYCTYCFRFNQFTGKDTFVEKEELRMLRYVSKHKEVSDVLVTGGDPATMKANVWADIMLPLLQPEFDHIRTIRVGTKALTYHPYRFLTDSDADDLIALFKQFKNAGKHVSIMAHFSHYQEITSVTKEAVFRLVHEAGCMIRTQAPVMRYINDDPDVWATMWQKQINLGMIPYYMFIARDTGPQRYFEVSLAKCLWVYQEARKRLSGLSHTARGPSMSCGPGKISILGREKIANEDVFVMKFLQGRNNDWCDRVFFAKYNEEATWIDQLEPAFGEKAFFFEEEYLDIIHSKSHQHDLLSKNNQMKESAYHE